jgi:hypothetical protein
VELFEEPPEDWPTPIDQLTPEAFEIARRSRAMVDGMREHYAGWGSADGG